MAYQSLYRRYRPQKFAEIRGQEHVIKALRNAVREDRVGHAYLLSGPRGTGKTTAARILAKVMNCEDITDGEPCGVCDSCRSIEAGTSFDLHELDAASNNKVDDVRDLLSKVALGTPGRTKVYLLDEVHMLTPGAENALLKTLEEPPDHVIFVLATTEPHKVVSTIRSRTQHLELTLISADEMTELVREVAADAELDIDDVVVGHVIKAGGGSARDTLSALDQAVAAGGIADSDTSTSELLSALSDSDPGRALSAVEAATERGVDPRRIGEQFVDALRLVFLVKLGSAPSRLSDPERELAEAHAPALSPAVITNALETVGRALVDMRQAPDPRIDLEVAIVRITRPAAGGDLNALVARIEVLERGRADTSAADQSAGQPDPSSAAVATTPPAPSEPPASEAPPSRSPQAQSSPEPVGESRGAQRARDALKPRGDSPPPPPSAARPSPDPAPTEPSVTGPAEVATTEPVAVPVPQPESSLPTTDSDGPIDIDSFRIEFRSLVDELSTAARARFLVGTVNSIDGNHVQFMLPNDAQLRRCEKFRADVEAALSTRLGRPMSLELSVGQIGEPTSSPAPAEQPEADHEVDLGDLTDAGDAGNTVVERIADVFPGAEMLTTPES